MLSIGSNVVADDSDATTTTTTAENVTATVMNTNDSGSVVNVTTSADSTPATTSASASTSEDEIDYGPNVPFTEFVEHTSRNILDSSGINGLFLTLGSSIIDNTNTGTCMIGGKIVEGTHIANVMHTVRPSHDDRENNVTASITVSSYPEGLITGIIFGKDTMTGEQRFLRLQYNDELLQSQQDEEHANVHYYGVLIEFPYNELDEIHVGGDSIVEIQEGFVDTSLVRVTDRAHVDMSYDGDNTLLVRSSKYAELTLDVGHHTYISNSPNKKIKAIASDSSVLKISGTVNTIECVNNATCIVDGKITSDDCNDSVVAMNATIETDSCSCVTVMDLPSSEEQPTSVTKKSIQTSSSSNSSSSISVWSIYNENYTAACLDTTYIKPVYAETDGPSTTNATFSCPATNIYTNPQVVAPVPSSQDNDDDGDENEEDNEDDNDEDKHEVVSIDNDDEEEESGTITAFDNGPTTNSDGTISTFSTIEWETDIYSKSKASTTTATTSMITIALLSTMMVIVT